MGWQRKIPFGYRIQGGQPTTDLAEAAAVQAIFTQYLAGASCTEIARAMEQSGLRYHQRTARWNKNMVHRILENEVYLGGKMYPRLIGSEDFLAVRLRRGEKNTYKPAPAWLDPIREKLVCNQCGGKLRRVRKKYGTVQWNCPDCGAIYYATDEALRDIVMDKLRALAASPEVLVMPAEAITPSPDVRRIESEITLCFNRADINPDYMKTLIFATASERYAAIPDPTPAHRLALLRERLEQHPADEADLRELLADAVKVVRLHKGGMASLELVSGMILDGRKEETE